MFIVIFQVIKYNKISNNIYDYIFLNKNVNLKLEYKVYNGTLVVYFKIKKDDFKIYDKKIAISEYTYDDVCDRYKEIGVNELVKKYNLNINNIQVCSATKPNIYKFLFIKKTQHINYNTVLLDKNNENSDEYEGIIFTRIYYDVDFK